MQPNLLSIRKKLLLSGVSSEYKDLAKFAEDTDSHLLREELEDSLRKSKGRHYNLQALNSKTNYPHPSAKRKFHDIQKNTTDQPKDPWLATRAPHSIIPHVHEQN